jgi:hypothetical protein
VTQGSPESHLDLEVLAAQLRRHSDDLSMYAGFLLNSLSAALPPEMVAVRREGKLKARLAGREPAVLAVSVTLGNHRYELERSEFGARPVAKVCHQSGGVVLSTRTVIPDEWSRGLAEALVRTLGSDAAAVAALQRLAAP